MAHRTNRSDVRSLVKRRLQRPRDETHWLSPWKPSKANLSTTSCSGFVEIVSASLEPSDATNDARDDRRL